MRRALDASTNKQLFWNGTQRQKLEYDSDSGSDPEEEAPQVVVIKKGDLTAEEAEQERKRIEKGMSPIRMHFKS